MIQSILEIEKHYGTQDPWGYQTHPDDLFRKRQIIEACRSFIPYGWERFESVLDIGAGEGWITTDLPAVTKYGYEISAIARSRFPENVIPSLNHDRPCELVTATGVLYRHYDVQGMLGLMKLATKFIVTCNIETWEVPQMSDPRFTEHQMGWTTLMEQRFKYREYFQKLRVFKVNRR